MPAGRSTPNIMSGLSDQRVIVTAGAGGIGLAVSKLLHGYGCKLAICDVDEEALERARSAMPGIYAKPADVSDESAIEEFFEGAVPEIGGLDALINNAGIAGPTGGVEEIAVSDWKRCLDIGLTGQFLCARLAVPHIKQAGGGSIVNMSSSAGRHGYAYRTPYSATKFGVIGFTQSLAKELGPANIRVNAILPGIVSGARMDRVIQDRAKAVGVSYDQMKERYLQTISLRRMVSPEDVAGSIAFLLSDAGKNLSAMSFNVDGNVETL